jgi:hypothetical protein
MPCLGFARLDAIHLEISNHLIGQLGQNLFRQSSLGCALELSKWHKLDDVSPRNVSLVVPQKMVVRVEDVHCLEIGISDTDYDYGERKIRCRHDRV